MVEETMPATETPAGFPVDLTREEYIAYYMLSARTVGPLRGRRWQMITTGVLCLMLLAVGLYEFFSTGVMDWVLLGLTLALAAVSGVMWLYIPERMKQQAARQYEETVESGYSYYGTVEVRPTEITKQGMDITTAIPLNATAMFIENKDMLVWMSRQGRAIVLPARCLTPDTAAAVRAAADRLPAQNRRFLARLVPGCQPVEEPQPVELVTLWERQVHYTPEEYAALAKSRMLSQFWRRLPLTMVMSLGLALLFAWPETSILPCVLAFLAIMAVQVVFGLVIPYTRVPRQPVDLPAALLTVSVTFTDRGVKLRNGDNFASVPWSAVEHVYDRGDYAEMLFHKQSLRIPKREIEDIEAFDGLLKQYWKNNK